MNELLWAGVDFKTECAYFHLDRMRRSLAPPDRWYAAVQSSGAIVDTGWQSAIYAHFDAFLCTVRSIPEIIQCCFGEDCVLKTWLDSLPAHEKDARRQFGEAFAKSYEEFRDLPLTKARNGSFHRTGFADVTVSISGRFGAYHGGPIKRMPLTEIAPGDPPLPLPRWERQLEPRSTDFQIDGLSLFPACEMYFESARVLTTQARSLAGKIHGAFVLTWPPM